MLMWRNTSKLFIVLAIMLTISSCAVVRQWLHVNPVPLSAVAPSVFSKTELGQVDVTLPELRSQRALVNNRRRFISYQGQGRLLLQLHNTAAVQLTINGKLIRIVPDATLGQYLQADIGQLTLNGINQLAITDIQPAGARLRVVIPYPQLTDSTAESAGVSYTKLATLDKLINYEIAQGFPGAVLVIVKDGKVIKETAYGYASRYGTDGLELKQPEPMQPDTLFDLASNTKMLATNLALMKLQTEGKLDINLPVQHYLPEYQRNGRASIRIKDLLEHRAGYAAEIHFHRPDNGVGPELYSLNRADTMALLTQKVPFAYPPGTQTLYSDIDYMLLGLIVERITGANLAEYVQRHIYQPMGLNNTLFNPLTTGIDINRIAATELNGNSRGGRVSFPAIRQGVIRGTVHDEKAYHAFDGIAGHAGLFSTARESAQLLFSALHGGYDLTTLFSQAVIGQFTRPSLGDHTMGLGWRTAVQGSLSWHFGPYASDYAFGHTGWTGTATLVDPHYGLIVILLTNKKHSPILSEGENNYFFAGDRFETGMYGSIMSKIYDAMLSP